MSAYIRRALSCRNLLLMRSSALHGHHISHIIRSPFNVDNDRILSVPAANFIAESRRAFAKGRKSKDDAGVTTIEIPLNVGPNIKANAVSQMEAAMAALSAELSKLRTGRASPGMLDHIIVETGGVKIPLNRVAVVSVMDPKTLSVNPYDPQTLKQLENAIVSSPLGLNPKADGERLIAVIPPLTKEHMQAMSKLATKSCEDARQSIRRARQKAMDAIKKLYSSLPKDDIKRLEKEVDDLTKKFIKNAEDVCKAKEKEISQAVILVIIVKAIVAATVVKGFGYNKKTSLLVGMSLAQIGEFAFVLLSRASNLHIVEGKLYLLLLGTTALSLVTTPLLFKLIPAVVHLGALLRWFPPDSPAEVPKGAKVVD